MTVRDLIEKKPMGDFITIQEKLLEGPLYARKSGNGKLLFDTRSNTKAHVEKFFDWKVRAMWPDFAVERRTSFSKYPAIVPVIGCYIIEPEPGT